MHCISDSRSGAELAENVTGQAKRACIGTEVFICC